MAKILVVDDEAAFLSAVSRQLERAGYEVLRASDGQQALELLQDHTVDLTIVDIFMPRVDGIEFTIRVKQRVPHAKIIVMSGGSALEKEQLLDITPRFGAVKTLGKPFEMDELLAVVRDVLGQVSDESERQP